MEEAKERKEGRKEENWGQILGTKKLTAEDTKLDLRVDLLFLWESSLTLPLNVEPTHFELPSNWPPPDPHVLLLSLPFDPTVNS